MLDWKTFPPTRNYDGIFYGFVSSVRIFGFIEASCLLDCVVLCTILAAFFTPMLQHSSCLCIY